MKKNWSIVFMICMLIIQARTAIADGTPSDAIGSSSATVNDSLFPADFGTMLAPLIVFALGVAGMVIALCVRRKK